MFREKTTKKRKKTNKKKKTTKKPSLVFPQSTTPNPSLPDDLLISCFARISRLHYPTLSLVSKSFASLLASPELYKARSFLGHTETCLYVSLIFHPDSNPSWFTLYKRPGRTITTSGAKKKKKKKSSGYVLAKIPTPYSRPAYLNGLVTVGSDIYNIGGSIDKAPSSSVWILDSRSKKRNYPAANVVDAKIYVAQGTNSSDRMEVFDPKTQTWELVSCPGAEILGCDGKLYISGRRGGRWAWLVLEKSSSWDDFSYSVIDNVLYYYNQGNFKWYDTKVRLWRSVYINVEGLPKLPRYGVRLSDYGGKMAVLWDRVLNSIRFKGNIISCAVIALRRYNDKIWGKSGMILGKVEWYDAVLTVPESCSVNYALATTL